MDPAKLRALPVPGLCLVAVQTATKAVTFFSTRHPHDQIVHLGTALTVENRLTVATAHADRLAAELRAQFYEKVLTAYGNRPWFLVDWEDVVAAIGEFDLATGRRQVLGDVALGDQVQVELSTASDPALKARGEITAISGVRFLVRLNNPIGELSGCWAPRSAIKPIRRACALVGAA